jgi:hypothetical protein
LEGRAAKTRAQAAAKLDKLGNPQEVPGTTVSIRIPLALSSPPAAEARRVKPGIVAIPGLKLTYEGFIPDQAKGQWSYYCYVGVTSGPLQKVAAQLRNELAKQSPGGTADWTDVSCETPDGQTTAWRKLRLLGKQEFYYKDKDGKDNYTSKVDSVLEIYLYEKGGQVVIVAWRLPAGIEPEPYVGLGELAPLVAGSVSIK